MNIFLQLFLLTLVPIGISFGLYFLINKTKFGKLPKIWIQVIVGVIFGCVSIFGTECGVTIDAATNSIANIRDSAPLLAGLLFGGPSGIIAGLIGGAERFFREYFVAVRSSTQIACAVSTILAGLYSALLNRFMFEKKRPSWPIAIAATVVIETFHFTMVFLTNMNNSSVVMETIKILALPMILANSFAVFVPIFVVSLIERKKANEVSKKKQKIISQVQWWLLASIVVSYGISTSIVFGVQTGTAKSEASDVFKVAIDDVCGEVRSESSAYLRSVLTDVIDRYQENPYENPTKDPLYRETYEDFLRELMVSPEGMYNLASVDLIEYDENQCGYFACSSYIDDEGNSFDYDSPNTFRMCDGEQSYELNRMMYVVDSRTGKVEPFIQEFMLQGDPIDRLWKKYAAAKLNDDYYIAISLSADEFYAITNAEVYEMTKYRRIGTEGYILILDGNGNPVSDVERFGTKKLGLDLEKLYGNPNELVLTEGIIYEQEVFYMYRTAETYKVITVMPSSEVLIDRDNSFVLNSFMEVLVFAILYSIIFSLIKRKVINGIDSVNNSLQKITNGDLKEKVNVESCYEFSSLSSGINFTVDTLKRYIEEAKKRIDDELAFAKKIQSSALPSAFPAFPDKTEFDIYATMDPAKEVGGDFYDFYIVDNDHVAFLVADVSGKGIPAAMFMMEGKTLIKNLAKSLLSPGEVMTKANDGLSQNNEAAMFITCWFGVLDFKTGILKFSNAGHNTPLIYRKGQGYSYFEQKRNMVLGAMEGMPYAMEEIKLEHGDRIFLYTDGVTEAHNVDAALYGEKRLMEHLNAKDGLTLEETLKGVKADVDSYADGVDQFDDITMLVLEYK